MSSIVRYLKEVKAEFYNITWPKRDALIQLTIVVISISIIISLILGGFDFLFTQSIALLGTANQTKSIQNNGAAPAVTFQVTPTIVTTPGPAQKITPTTKAIKK